MRLVKDARKAWRWFSVQLAAVSAIAPGAWLMVPDDMRKAVPPEWLAGAGVVLGVLIIAGRLIDQDGDDAG